MSAFVVKISERIHQGAAQNEGLQPAESTCRLYGQKGALLHRSTVSSMLEVEESPSWMDTRSPVCLLFQRGDNTSRGMPGSPGQPPACCEHCAAASSVLLVVCSGGITELLVGPKGLLSVSSSPPGHFNVCDFTSASKNGGDGGRKKTASSVFAAGVIFLHFYFWSVSLWSITGLKHSFKLKRKFCCTAHYRITNTKEVQQGASYATFLSAPNQMPGYSIFLR